MKSKAHVVIIGGGVIGLSIAYNLAIRGFNDVVILEKGYLGSGATRRCAEGIRAQFNLPHNITLARESIKLYEKLSAELGYNVLFFQSGYLFLACTEDELSLCKENVRVENSLGVKSRLITPEEAREIVPILNVEGVIGATFHQKDGAAHHDATVEAYARAARRLGVQIHEYTEARRIKVGNGRVQGVVTDKAEIEADIVVNAAGSHSKDIAGTVGVELPIKPERHEVLVTEPMKPCLDPMVISLHTGLYCRQTLRGEILGGIGFPDEPASYNIRSSLRFLETFAREVMRLFPPFRSLKVMRQWAGLYDVTPDGTPILGEVDELPGFIQANGFSGHGFMLAPIVGKLISELIIYGKPSISLEPFNLRRFREGKLQIERTVVG